MEAELSTAAKIFLSINLGAFLISFFGVLICAARDDEGAAGFFFLTGAISFGLLIIFGVGHL